jgi:hypothetical protein
MIATVNAPKSVERNGTDGDVGVALFGQKRPYTDGQRARTIGRASRDSADAADQVPRSTKRDEHDAVFDCQLDPGRAGCFSERTAEHHFRIGAHRQPAHQALAFH